MTRIFARYSRARGWLVRYAFPIQVFFITRASLMLVAYLALATLPLLGDNYWRAHPDNLLIDGWARWDSGWYIDIATDGYTTPPKWVDPETVHQQRDVAFFPLYPLLMRLGMVITGDAALSGILISHLAFLLALCILFDLVRTQFDEETARRTIILLSVYPYALFFGAVYSEAIFLLCAALAFACAYRGVWWAAGLAAAAASATRLPGILLLPALGVLYLETIQFDWRRIRPHVLWLLLGALGAGGYFAYLWFGFGLTPGDYLFLQDMGWDNDLGFRFQHMVSMFGYLTPPRLLNGQYPVQQFSNFIAFVTAIPLAVYALRRARPAYGVWALLMIGSSFGGWVSAGRYSAVIFPLFIALALLLKKEGWFNSAIYSSIALLAFFTALFANWYWVS